MGSYYDYDYSAPVSEAAFGVAGFALVFILLFYLLLLAWCVVNYVLYSLSIYKIAQRRGIHHPWLAWLPLGNVWVLGSISDQYQYVVKNRVCSRRKVLLGLSIGMCATIIPAFIALFSAIFSEITGSYTASEALIGVTVALLLLAYLATVVLTIIMLVFEYIALYDLFSSCDPSNAVLYLVLSILLGVVLPFFLFACRNKDLGMPPRKIARPVIATELPAQETEE